MVIKILGTGCSTCKALFNTVEHCIQEMGIQATVFKEEDLLKIMEYNILSLPAMVVDDKVVAVGNLTSKEVKQILTEQNQEK